MIIKVFQVLLLFIFISVQPASMLKLPKFEVDLPAIPKPPKLCLLERDVTLANM